MTAVRPSGLALALLLTPVGLAQAEVPTIEHSAIKCLVAGKYRKMPARFAPDEVAQPRVYFRPAGVPSWYYVEMKPEAPLGHVGVLPKPTKKLVGQHIEYYVEAASKEFDTGRTPEYDPVVVAKDSDCGNDAIPALYSKSPPSGVFPSVPQGFTVTGGIAAGTTAAVVGGAAAAGGAAVVIANKDDETPTVTQPPATNPPVTNPPVIPTPPPPTTLGPVSDVACQADPRQGRAPLRVSFSAQASGGTGVFNFEWDFGDGGTSTQVNPSHTYTTPGVYEARVVAISGDRRLVCSRSITVLANSVRLDVNPAGTGTGRITGDGIDCPGDCSEEYAPGTSVSLTAQPTGGSTFAGWSGACTGTGSCSISMDADRSVTASFTAAALVPLTVTVNGSGTGSVTSVGITCPGDCTESYAAGTNVILTANPTGGSSLTWGGDCAGTTGTTCSIFMNAPRNVVATFNQATFRLSVTVIGFNGASGSVRVLPSTFATCNSAPGPTGNTCVADYAPGEPIALFATTSAGSFTGWTGDCASAAGPTCNVIMSQDRTTTATWNSLALVPRGQATVASTFEVAGARGQALLNAALLTPPAPGMTVLTVSPVTGENRLEAQLVGGGKAGTWRFDLSGIPGLERGSLRVLAGDATAIGPDAVVFRLAGREGERIEVAFTTR
jgi:uncharacterized repeat protein (TIGR02543 family)